MNKLLNYMCRINNARTVGSYSLDFDNGEIEFHLFMPCFGEVVDCDVLEFYTVQSMWLAEKYSDGFLSIIFGNADPEKTFLNIERLLD